MKILVSLLLTITGILCEVSPPYASRGFRPSSQLSLPQRTYGFPNTQPSSQLSTKYGPPPPSNAEPLDPSFQDNSNPIKFTLNNQYRTIKDTFGPVRAPQRLYGVPKIVNSQPQNTFGAPQKQQLPQNVYGAPTASNPSTQSGSVAQPQIYYGAPATPQKQQLPQVQSQNAFSSLPQTLYGAPIASNSWTQSGSVAKPQRNYGIPDSPKATVDAATLEEIRELKQVLQRIEALRLTEQRTNQYIAQQQSQQFSNRFVQNLPTRDSSNFKNSLTDQYLPVKETENFKKFVASSSRFSPQDSSNTNFVNNIGNNDNTQSFRGDEDRVTSNRYVPPNQNNNNNQGGSTSGSSSFGSVPTSSWNNLDLPNINNGNVEPNNGFSNSNPPPNSVPSVDVQKVEVTQFGPRNRNRNNSAGSGTTFRPPIDDSGAGSNEDRVNNRYIPPTIEKPVLRGPLPTTPLPTEPDYLDQGDVADTPNIAVATSVAVPQEDQQFYLLQPDGTYQSIVLQKGTRQGKTIPYGQNYVLQNLRTDSNIAYTPVVSLLGK